MLDSFRARFRTSPRKANRSDPAVITLDLDDGPATVRIRRNNRARRMTLRHDAATGEAVVTLPKNTALECALSFLDNHRGWISERRRRHGPPIPFAPGAEVPVRGVPHLLQQLPARRGVIEVRTAVDKPVLAIPGDMDHFARRLSDWLKRQARADLDLAVSRHADRLGVRPTRLSIRDQRSRWGSCSHTGGLAFSWRLILAPNFVLDYVAAHEVAHLVEMNHSDAFWRTLRETDADVDRAEAWLKAHGAKLHRYGRAA
ncbi:MAG: SprT family zinc-dependent metalloprotease [Pseudomonadota bacterium]